MNHKRKRPKHQRAGCLMCKPYKDERVKGSKKSEKPSVRRKIETKETMTDEISSKIVLRGKIS